MQRRQVFELSATLLLVSLGSLGEACRAHNPYILSRSGAQEAADASAQPGAFSNVDGSIGASSPEAGTKSGRCAPRTCSQLGAKCGPQGDGCGGVIECGGCQPNEICGGAGPSQCGVPNAKCAPKTCAELQANCGKQGDGCGGVVECGTCKAPQICGGDGFPSVCGGGVPKLADGGVCLPMKSSCAPGDCGPVADGCGGLIVCGACTAPQTCGGGGTPSVCGGNSGCVPTTCNNASASCGPIGDGCGGSLDCGACIAPEICGGGGKPNVCGGGSVNHLPDGGMCVPTKISCAAEECGPIGNGCGALLQCNSCQSPQICGGGINGQPGKPSKCGGTLPDGGTLCKPRSCQQAGANCGPIGDGCGGVIPSCGDCPFGQICGGGGVPSMCGPTSGNGPDGGTCTGLCTQQVQCSGTLTTTASGVIYAPNGIDPLYNAVIYVPNAAVAPLTAGVSCQQCGSEVSGSPLTKAFTGPDGKFTLYNVPVGANIPFVVQLGRWRRQVVYTIPSTSACKDTVLPATLTRLPRNKSEGDIPLTAIATGMVDTLECVLRKIGIADSEFSDPSGAGRIHLYAANGAVASALTPSWNQLWGSLATLKRYDLVLLPCEGFADTAAVAPASGIGISPQQKNLIDYTALGGRVYATHYSYTWFANSNTATNGPLPFSSTAQYHLDQPHPADPNAVIGDINTSFPKGQAFAAWLGNVNALTTTTPPRITLNISRHDADAVVAPSQSWVTVDPILPTGGAAPYPGAPQHFTFNTPVGAPSAQQCGRVLYSDFHVSNASAQNVVFPAECASGALTAQEKVLEFMLFDLAACIQPDQPPTCTAKSCAQQGIGCGPAGDGCGKLLDCGGCPTGQTCGGGGVASQCGAPSCTKLTCAQAGAACGDVADGCGGVLSCGSCPTGQTCGGGGAANQCGNASCSPLTCRQAGARCGPAGDGCGHLLDCGPCPSGQTCGGAGVPSQCGKPPCTASTCQQAAVSCGDIGDGCGGLLHCGTCNAPQTCGGGGVAGQCGAPSCQPRTCQQMGVTCGPSGDGCGGLLDCGACPPACTPRTCADAGAECGKIGDNCGALIDCGTCTAPDTCGGGGSPNVCGRDYVP